ncbi:MAG: hypothetical protein QXL78_03710 [Methanocellales archaeon]
MLKKKAIALILILTLLILLISLSSSLALASNGEKFLRLKKATIKSSGSDLYIYLEYELSIFAKFYLWLLGSKAIEPELVNSLHGFNDLSALEIKSDGAVLISRNSVKEAGSYYLFYGGSIEQPVNLRIEVPHSTVKQYWNTQEIPPFWISK